MSPNGQSQGKAVTSNNLYTVILALAFLAVLATVALVAYKCYVQYGTILKIP
jgi:Tfp pilus assembly protein PilE